MGGDDVAVGLGVEDEEADVAIGLGVEANEKYDAHARTIVKIAHTIIKGRNLLCTRGSAESHATSP